MIEFPISTGLIVSKVKAALTASSNPISNGVGVSGRLPDVTKRTARMVTFRDDSGPREGVLSRRRYGVNVYASNAVDAEKLANLVMSILSDSANAALPAFDSFSGPYEIPDESPVVVGGVDLANFYFTFRASVRAI